MENKEILDHYKKLTTPSNKQDELQQQIELDKSYEEAVCHDDPSESVPVSEKNINELSAENFKQQTAKDFNFVDKPLEDSTLPDQN